MFGRDAGSDVVVTGNDVSRRHAEIQASTEGYVLVDLERERNLSSTGKRVGRRHLLARADVIRIGNDEFRFYAESAPAQAPMGPRPPRHRKKAPRCRARRPAPANRLSDTMHGLPLSDLQGRRRLRRQPEAAPIASLLVRSGVAARQAAAGDGPGGQHRPGRLQRHRDLRAERQHHARQAPAQRRRLGADRSGLHQRHLRRRRAGDRRDRAHPGHDPASSARWRYCSSRWTIQPRPRAAGTEAMQRVGGARDRPAKRRRARPAARRPLRASAPKPSGPPAWLIAR